MVITTYLELCAYLVFFPAYTITPYAYSVFLSRVP